MFNFFKKDKKNIVSEGFEALKNALSKTSKALIENVVDIASSNEEIDEFTLEDIEATLIKADLGVDLSVEIVEKIKSKNLKSSELKDFLRKEFEEILANAGSNKLNYRENSLNIYFIAGVNGAGKTTLIGKLAKRFKDSGKKVLLAAGDTFRAAAEEQLEIWAHRAGVEIVRRDKADSASVVYEAIERAKKEGNQAVIISAEIESEVARLTDPEEQKEFLETLGLQETGLNRVIHAGYRLLDLMTFFTVGPKESRAWTIKKGMCAPQAAGVIHSDFEKGFIRAEIISYEDFVECKSEARARELGKLRSEGKTYEMHDGDICHFLFNV